MKQLILFFGLVSFLWAQQIIMITKPGCSYCEDQKFDMESSKTFQLFLRENGIEVIEYVYPNIPPEYETPFYPTTYMLDDFGIVYSELYGLVSNQAIIYDMTEKYVDDNFTNNR